MRTRYMPEDVFNLGVAAIVWIHLSNGDALSKLAATIAAPYRADFIDDGFEADLVRTGEALRERLRKAEPRFPGDSPEFQSYHMMFFFAKYNLDGSKKRWRLFGGSFFMASREPIKERQAQFFAAYARFVLLTMLGKVPPPPRGWRL